MVQTNQDHGKNLNDCQTPSRQGELSDLALATFSRSHLFILLQEQNQDCQITEFSAQTFISDLEKVLLIVDQIDSFPGFRRSVISPHQVLSEILGTLKETIATEKDSAEVPLVDYLKSARKVLNNDQFQYLELMLRMANDHERLSLSRLPRQEREKLLTDRFSSANRFNYYASLVHRVFYNEDLSADQSSGARLRIHPGNRGNSPRGLAS